MNVDNLNEPNEARGSINDFIKGFYQADVLLAKIFIKRKSSIIVTSDSDFFACLCSKMFLLKKFKYDMKNKVMNDIVLAYSDKKMGKNKRKIDKICK